MLMEAGGAIRTIFTHDILDRSTASETNHSPEHDNLMLRSLQTG